MFFTSSPLSDLLVLIILAIYGCHIVYLKRKGRWMLLDPLNMFWCGILVCYVYQPLAYFHRLLEFYSEAVLVKTLFWIAVSLVFVSLGYEFRGGVKLGNKLPSMPRDLKPHVLTATGIVMVFLGFVGYAFLFWSAGGAAAWFGTSRGGTDWASLSGYVTVLEYFLPAGITILLFRVELFPTLMPQRVFIWTLGGLQWLWFVYLGSRLRTGLFLMAMLTAYFLPRRKNPPMWAAFIGLLLIGLLVSFQAYYRSQFTNLSFNLGQLRWSEVRETILPSSLGGNRLETGNLGDLEFNCVAAVVDLVPQSVDYNYGYTLLEIPTHAVPRYFWPTKFYPMYEAQTPIMLYGNLSRHWMTPTPNTRYLAGPSFTFAGYWYHAGGPIALMIAGFLTGIGLRALRQFFERDPANQSNLIIYSLLLPIGFYESAFTPLYWLFSLPIVVIPVILLLRMARQRQDDNLPMPALA